MINITEEKMSEHFMKFHLNGLPFSSVIHHFNSLAGENAHDHPFSFVSHVLSGGYVEKVYHINEDGSWTSEIVERLPGTVHRVEANHIHEIIDLPEGECYTLIIPSPKIQESSFYRFGDIIEKRFWYEEDFKYYKHNGS